MESHPLLYGVHERIVGHGFIAVVSVENARCLAVREGNDWWTYGVCPGAIAATGGTLTESFAGLRDGIRRFLFDVASSSRTFTAFEAEVERFFKSEDESAQSEWFQAVRALKASKASPGKLGWAPSESPRNIVVANVRQPTAVMNRIDAGPLLAR